MMYSGDEYYDDDITSGRDRWSPHDEEGAALDEIADREPYEPSPYDGTYSED
jgi:hypothetical protein